MRRIPGWAVLTIGGLGLLLWIAGPTWIKTHIRLLDWGFLVLAGGAMVAESIINGVGATLRRPALPFLLIAMLSSIHRLASLWSSSLVTLTVIVLQLALLAYGLYRMLARSRAPGAAA